MIFINACITFIQIMLSIKELGLVKTYTKKSWMKIFAIGGLSCVIVINAREISTILLILSPLLILIWEKNKIINSLVSETIAIFIAFLSDLLFSPIFIKVDNNKAFFDGNMELAASSVNCLLSLLICKFIYNVFQKLIRKLRNPGSSKEVVNMKQDFIILFCVIILLIFVLNIYVMREINITVEVMYLAIIVSVSYFVVFGIIAFITYKNLKNQVIEKAKKRQLEDVKEYNKNLEILYDDMRKFKHDYVNILSSMAGYIEDTDMKGLRNYFEKKIVPLGTEISEKNSRIVLLHNIHIKEIKGLVLTKVLRAQELGVNVYIDIAEEIDFINIDMVDLCRCIGILLDNAIESAVKCKNGEIKIGFVKKSESLLMAIINSIVEEIPPIYKIYEKGFSTKGNDRGIGLTNLREILSKYSHITIDTIIEENEFKQIVEIC